MVGPLRTDTCHAVYRPPCRGQATAGCNCPGNPAYAGQKCHFGVFMDQALGCGLGDAGRDVLCWSARAPKLDGKLRTPRASGILHEAFHLVRAVHSCAACVLACG